MPRLHHRAGVCLFAIGLAVLLASCGSGPQPTASVATNQPPSGAQPVPQRLVTIVLRAEPPMIGDRLDRMGLPFPWVVSLTYTDAHDATQPLLAERLPTQADGTWIVNADGSMKTTYSLRSGLRWQDGEPLTASDFVFAHNVYTDPEIPVTTRLPESLMSNVVARDDRTLEIDWQQTYVGADALVLTQLAPIPRHLMLDLFNSDKNAFSTSGFWSSPDFVGDGPFRVTQWERGVAITGAANPYFVFG